MNGTAVSVKFEWDMGHRLPNHQGACSQLHGHRYVAEFVVVGPIINTPGDPSEGMVIDFQDIKRAVKSELEAFYDHRFLVHADDEYRSALEGLPGVRVVNYVPTGENIAAALLEAFKPLLPGLLSIKLYETPGCYAEVM